MTSTRGRPRKAHAGLMAYVRSQYPELTTDRSRMDRYYSIRAIRSVRDDPTLHWLLNENLAGGTGWRWGLLAELGRVAVDHGEDHARAWARILCESKPSVRAGAAEIRRWRTGRSGEGDAMALTTAVFRAVDAYIATHPDVTRQQVLAALDNARALYSEAASDTPPEPGF